MKRLDFVLLTAAIVLLSAVTAYAGNTDVVYTEGPIQYTIEETDKGNYISITGYYGDAYEYLVPWMIGTTEVKEIKSGAFENSSANKVYVPENAVTEEGAFRPGQNEPYNLTEIPDPIEEAPTVPDSDSEQDFSAEPDLEITGDDEIGDTNNTGKSETGDSASGGSTSGRSAGYGNKNSGAGYMNLADAASGNPDQASGVTGGEISAAGNPERGNASEQSNISAEVITDEGGFEERDISIVGDDWEVDDSGEPDAGISGDASADELASESKAHTVSNAFNSDNVIKWLIAAFAAVAAGGVVSFLIRRKHDNGDGSDHDNGDGSD